MIRAQPTDDLTYIEFATPDQMMQELNDRGMSFIFLRDRTLERNAKREDTIQFLSSCDIDGAIGLAAATVNIVLDKLMEIGETNYVTRNLAAASMILTNLTGLARGDDDNENSNQ